MTDQDDMTTPTEAEEPTPRRISSRTAIVLVVIAIFAGLFAVKALDTRTQPAAGDSITSVKNDAVADYEAALQTGKPIYVLFHSLS